MNQIIFQVELRMVPILQQQTLGKGNQETVLVSKECLGRKKEKFHSSEYVISAGI